MAREMKDSGIEWIGEIPSEWKVLRTKNAYSHHKNVVGNKSDNYERLALTLNGVIKRSKEDSTGLQPEAFNSYQILRENELVFKLIDLENISTSRVGLSPFEGLVSPAYIVLEPKENAFSKFGFYYFLSMWHRYIFNHLGDDGVRSSLNSSDLLNIPYVAPPLPEQHRIADFLDRKCAEIDRVLEKTRASIEEYKKLKQSVITQAVTKGVRGEREMKDSGIEWIGEIPAEWKITRIKWLLQERKEYSQLGNEEPLSMSQKHGIIPTRLMEAIPNMASSFVGSKIVHSGDLVFNKLKAHLGVFSISCHNGIVSPDYAVYYATGVADVKFLQYLFKTDKYITEFKKRSTGVGAGLTRLYTDGLFSIHTALPLINEQVRIVAYLDKKCSEIETLICKKEQFITELESYKKSFIYEYVTGKKEVQ